MAVLLFLPFVFSSFVQKWYVPCGLSAGIVGRICIQDADRDGSYEFYISNYSTSFKVYVYELHLPNTWERDSFSYFWGPLVWDNGDFDLDGLSDLVIETAVEPPPINIITIAESADSFSYPTQEVWRDTMGFLVFASTAAFDLDDDGWPEIVDGNANYNDFNIYECTGDNIYSLVYASIDSFGCTSTFAFGDFDIDNLNEFVYGNLSGLCTVYECTGNNTYQRTYYELLPTVNILDCFSVPDADQDGKMEFVVKGSPVSGPIDAFIFEATTDNTYEIIKTFTLPGGDYYGGYSDAGDVDGDSVVEIVLEAMYHVYIIKAAGNDSFYIWDSLPGHGVGSNIRIFDVDDNGLNDIVVSGGNETRIYEYDEGTVKETPISQPASRSLELTACPNLISYKFAINYTIPQESMIKLSLYDVAGRLIAVLVHEFQKPGTYRRIVDTENLTHAQGVYFVRLETDEHNLVTKIVILR